MSADKRVLFNDIYTKNKGKIFKLCLGYAGDRDVANDLMQDTFVKVWNHLDTFRNDAAVSTWIYRIAVNTCLGYLRTAKNKPSEALNDYIIETKQEEQIDTDVKVQILYKSISKLEENDRLIITMVLDDLEYSEIAAISGISEGNLRVRIHRIKIRLTEIYKRTEQEMETAFMSNKN